MHSNRFTAILDANVLVPALTRNILLTLADAQLYRARWTMQILDEMERGIIKDCDRLGLEDGRERAMRTRNAMTGWPGFADCSVDDYQSLEPSMPTPDANDRHVMAAAVKTRASVIVTSNLRDFPQAACAKFEMEVKTPDSFIADTVDLDPARSLASLRIMRGRLRKPPFPATELIEKMHANGLVETVTMLETHKHQL